MSIESSLVKLADKIDVDGKSTISPEYKNPNNSIEKSLERIANQMDKQGKSDVVPDYKNPNQSIEKSMERIAEHYTSGGSGGDETFDILFSVQDDEVELVHGSYSDIDWESDTPPSVGVIVSGQLSASVEWYFGPEIEEDSVGFRISYSDERTFYRLIILYSDDSVTIEPTDAPPLDIKRSSITNTGGNTFRVRSVLYDSSTGRFEIAESMLSSNNQALSVVPAYIEILDRDTGLPIDDYKITPYPADNLSYSSSKEQWIFNGTVSVVYDPDAPMPN